MIDQAVMIISGYNFRAVVAFCRWATANKIRFHIVARNEEDPIFLTDYKNHVSFTRDSPKLQHELFRMWIDSLCHQFNYKKIIILPSTEYLNRFLLENRNSIESENCAIPLVNEQLYRKISDKHSFSKLCLEYGLDVPDEFDQCPACLPFVAKPRSYFSSRGTQLIPQLIHEAKELKLFRSTEDESDYFFQQFVFGHSLYLLAYIGESGSDNTTVFSQENLMQQARGASIILAKTSKFHQSEIARRYVAMLQEQNFTGLIMVEVRLDETNGRYYMIEANPRLWGPMQFCVDNNIDLFGAMLRDCGFEIPKISSLFVPKDYYFWSDGITQLSQPIAYHCYTGNEFASDFHKLRATDIFSRKDTIEYHLEQLSQERSYE